MKKFLEYLNLVWPDLIAKCVALYIFIEFLWTGKIYEISLEQLVFIMIVLFLTIILMVWADKRQDRILKNKDCLPKQE